MKILFLSILLVFSNTSMVLGQNWPEQGGTWIYSFYGLGDYGDYELVVGEDTVINNQAAKALLRRRNTTIPTDPYGGTYTAYGVFEPLTYLFYEGDSLSYLDGDTFRLLYDFGAEVGDSWLVKVEVDANECPDSSYTTVVGIGTEFMNGQERRYIDLEGVNQPEFLLAGRAIEGIGLVSGIGFTMLPAYNYLDGTGCLVWDGDETTFSCYHNDVAVYPDTASMCSLDQPWSIPNGRWCFFRDQVGPIVDDAGCECWDYQSDTLIDGRMYQRLAGQFDYTTIIAGDTVSSGTIIPDDIFITTHGDSTWYYYEGGHRLLADFSAQPGDSWTVTPQPTSIGFQGVDMTIVVDSVYTDLFNQTQRRVIAFTSAIALEDPDCVDVYSGQIVEGLYFKTDLSSEAILPVYPDMSCSMEVNDLHFFIAHENDVNELYTEGSPGNYNCDGIGVGLEEYSIAPLKVYPNPVTDMLAIQWPEGASEALIRLTDMQGRIAHTSSRIAGDNRLNMDQFPEGMYVLELFTSEGVYMTRVVNL